MPEMYTMTLDGKPVAYRYGESWEAARLFIEGGYPTKKEAKAAWEKEQEEGHDSD